MKIKVVCELTGLSDRTIRYYIEQELITPHYTENYLGRRTFDFTETDIENLNNIATLRKFDFTIEEIRKIITGKNNSSTIIENVKSRTEKLLNEGQVKLEALESLDIHKEYTIKELAELLDTYAADKTVINESNKRSIGKAFLSLLKSVITFIIVWLPIAVSVIVFVLRYFRFAYPHFNNNAKVYIILFLALLPSISVLIISKLKFSWKKIAKGFLLILCILSLPWCLFSPIAIINHSETTNIRNYRHFDVDCTFDQETWFNDLFPYRANYWDVIDYPDGRQETIYLDARYYYRYAFFTDDTYDVYAEWPLEEDEFYKEVERAEGFFEKHMPSEENHMEYVATQKGDYFCHILYDTYGGEGPFEESKDNYTYYIFAYNKNELRVRYIYCYSLENGADQPYYLELDW